MPSEELDNYWDGRWYHENRWRRLPKVVLAGFMLVFIAAVVAVFTGFGIKIYVIASNSFTAFEACRVQYVWNTDFFCVISFSLFFGLTAIGGLLIVCGGSDDVSGDEVDDILSKYEFIPAISAMGVLTYSFIAFGTNLLIWLGTDAPEEAFLVYAEFYEDDFSKCASGQDLVYVGIALMLYKVESFIVMMLILLACLGFVFYAALRSE